MAMPGAILWVYKANHGDIPHWLRQMLPRTENFAQTSMPITLISIDALQLSNLAARALQSHASNSITVPLYIDRRLRMRMTTMAIAGKRRAWGPEREDRLAWRKRGELAGSLAIGGAVMWQEWNEVHSYRLACLRSSSRTRSTSATRRLISSAGEDSAIGMVSA
jgi:hypothetical protein